MTRSSMTPPRLLRNVLPVLLAACLVIVCEAQAARVKKVLLIGIDGCRADCITDKIAPTLAGLADKGRFTTNGYAGGELGAKSQQPTFSGPGWSTILTGVWTDKHGVTNNNFTTKALVPGNYPHAFSLYKHERPAMNFSSFVCWSAIDKFIVAPVRKDFAYTYDGGWKGPRHEEGDVLVHAELDKRLAAADDDATFVHYGQVDGNGHGFGFSDKVPQYVAALKRVDGYIAEDLAIIRARKNYANEDWLIVVTTDHGGKGKSHGSQDEVVRRIFMIANGPGVSPERVRAYVPQAAIQPTVAEWLGITPKPEWGWVAKSFLK